MALRRAFEFERIAALPVLLLAVAQGTGTSAGENFDLMIKIEHGSLLLALPGGSAGASISCVIKLLQVLQAESLRPSAFERFSARLEAP